MKHTSKKVLEEIVQQLDSIDPKQIHLSIKDALEDTAMEHSLRVKITELLHTEVQSEFKKAQVARDWAHALLSDHIDGNKN